MSESTKGVVLTEAQLKSRRSRNIAIGLVCGGLVVLFYVMTWVKFSASMLAQAS
jgi:hypothetical protein